jgi:bacterioferritin
MVFGHGRIPIIDWLNSQAIDNLEHAREAAEMITHLGEHPSLGIGPLLETHKHDIDDILRESLAFELEARDAYRELHDVVEGHSMLLEHFAHQHIVEEENHADEVGKMLRKPGDVKPA